MNGASRSEIDCMCGMSPPTLPIGSLYVYIFENRNANRSRIQDALQYMHLKRFSLCMSKTLCAGPQNWTTQFSLQRRLKVHRLFHEVRTVLGFVFSILSCGLSLQNIYVRTFEKLGEYWRTRAGQHDN